MKASVDSRIDNRIEVLKRRQRVGQGVPSPTPPAWTPAGQRRLAVAGRENVLPSARSFSAVDALRWKASSWSSCAMVRCELLQLSSRPASSPVHAGSTVH
jgi:hypothetical protein